MEINRDSIVLKNDITCFSDSISNECKTEIDSNSVSKILGIYVKSVNNEGEILENSIKYKSGIIYSICYIDNEKNIRKSECLGEICGDIKGTTSKGYLHIDVKTEKVEADISSLKLTLKGIFKVTAIITDFRKSEFVCPTENLIVKKEDCEYYKSYGKRKTIFPIEEEFELGYSISNVLMHKITPVITSVQCGVGCIIVDGEVHIFALLLQNSEKRDIIKEEKVIPFRAEIEYEEAMPSMIATAEVFEKNFKTDVSVDEDGNSCTVNANVTLLLEGEAFSVVNAEIYNDAFSLTNDIETKFIIENKTKPKEQKNLKVELISSAVSVDGVEDAEFILCAYENVEITETKKDKDCLLVYGVLSYTAFFKNAEGEIITRRIEYSFENKLDVNISNNENYKITAEVIGVTPNGFSNGEISFKYTLNFVVFCEEVEKVKLLTDVTLGEEKKLDKSSISVYISMPDEDLWSLSKRLNTPPEEICETNKELQFPLSGKERIVVYRQKK